MAGQRQALGSRRPYRAYEVKIGYSLKKRRTTGTMWFVRSARRLRLGSRHQRLSKMRSTWNQSRLDETL